MLLLFKYYGSYEFFHVHSLRNDFLHPALKNHNLCDLTGVVLRYNAPYLRSHNSVVVKNEDWTFPSRDTLWLP
jgi:hypothetical protein